MNRERLPEKLALTDRAVHFAPVPYACRYALLLALAGERDTALRQLERSLRAYPQEARDITMQLAPLARDRPNEFMSPLELARASGDRRVQER
jgi:hypothetical protein